MIWFAFLFWGVVVFGCAMIIVLGILTRPRHKWWHQQWLDEQRWKHE